MSLYDPRNRKEVFYRGILDQDQDLPDPQNREELYLKAIAEHTSKYYGAPLIATTAADMTDKDRVYVYTGSEAGYTAGDWYYWDGSSWVDGGVYNAVAVQTDTTLTQAGEAADAKTVGDRALLGLIGLTSLSQIVSPYNDCNTFPKNSIISFVVSVSDSDLAHKPSNFSNGNIITFDYNATEAIGVQCQLAIPNSNTDTLAYRNNWGGTWKSWRYVQSDTDVAAAITAALSSYAPKTVTDLAVYGQGSIYASTPPSPYNDMNTFTTNTIMGIAANGNTIANAPTGFTSGTIVTLSYTNAGSLIIIQFVCQSTTNEIYFRSKYASTWTAWRTLTFTINDLIQSSDFADAVDQINLDSEPFSMSMFENIGVIGDSYASGLIVDTDPPINVNKYNLSWIQIMGRHFGINAVNYSFSGATIKSWMNDTTHTGYNFTALMAGDPLDLYYIAMGINESSAPADVGTIADIKPDYHDNPDTFYGNMGRVIEQIEAHAPDGKIILCTSPFESQTAINAAIEEIATHYGIGLITTLDDAFFSSSYYTNFRTNHPTAPGYSGYAMAYARLTYKAIANNVSYFKYYVGTT